MSESDFRQQAKRFDGINVVYAPLGHLFVAFLIHDVALFDGLGWGAANRRFNTAMKALGAPVWQRTAIMAAVKGNARWQKTRKWFGWSSKYV